MDTIDPFGVVQAPQKDGFAVTALHVPHNPFDPGYYGSEELRTFGFAAVGDDVRIGKTCTIIGLANITIGSHVRIDDRVTMIAAKGRLSIGSYIHIGESCYLTATGGITLSDFSGLSQGVRIYSVTEDYNGDHLTNPTVPQEFLGMEPAPVVLAKHVIIGSGSVILPGCTIGEGSSVGALSLVTKSLDAWGVYVGAPAKFAKARSKKLLDLEQRLIAAQRKS
jgi:galactoside O-acetyltransferase